MGHDMVNQIIEFIEENQGRDRKTITIDTRLEKDLGITGDDATEFLIAFGKKFNVDVSNFMAADYFGDEGFDIIAWILNFFPGGKERKSLTVAHLEKAVIAGRLDETVINS
jgi:acyl carrier protein